MVWTASGIAGYAIVARDGRIGSVDDFLFDDATWTVRWLVVDTGSWLSGRRVLLPPARLGPPDAAEKSLAADLTRRQIEESPEFARDPPVSRQEETMIYHHYGWEPYWSSGFAMTAGLGVPPIQPPLYDAGASDRLALTEGDPGLRSAREITGYHIEATDGAIGHVEELLIDAAEWTVRYLVVDTRNWWPGKKVVIAPHWADAISWSERTVSVELTRERIRNAPEYDEAATLDRGFEERLYRHYDRPGYWF
jgi:hypothetical protein